jgi:hypothetical protein
MPVRPRPAARELADLHALAILQKLIETAAPVLSEVDGRLKIERALKDVRRCLGACVPELRRNRRVSALDLARRIGSSPKRIEQLERGSGSLDMITRAILALGPSLEELVGAIARAKSPSAL